MDMVLLRAFLYLVKSLGQLYVGAELHLFLLPGGILGGCR
jgi:hypothetical protein